MGNDIAEIENLIDDMDDSTAVSWGEDCAKYLAIIAKTQLLILKRMKTNEIVDKIKSGKFTKDELASIVHACHTAISEGNHEKSICRV